MERLVTRPTPERAQRVLIIEDDPNDIKLLRLAFQDTPVADRLDIVRDGDEAIEYLTSTGRHDGRRDTRWPALIILDLNLPGRKGHEILRWLRWEAGVTQLPVIVLTSSVSPADVHRAYELGANSYLEKPTSHASMRELAEMVATYWLDLNVGGSLEDA